MIRFVTVIAGMLLLSACVHIPFREADQVSLESVEPYSVVEQYRLNTPVRFQLLNSVVFDYSWQSFMAIGYVSVDRENSSFRVACLNPMGVQLFELSGDRDRIVTHNVLPVLMEYGDLPAAVGSDIRRIYFDMLPSDKARIWQSRYKISFREPYGAGVMEYDFAGKGHELVEKTYYEDDQIVWRISYYEYREQNGKHYPQGIIMHNYRHGYQLTVRQKELHS